MGRRIHFKTFIWLFNQNFGLCLPVTASPPRAQMTESAGSGDNAMMYWAIDAHCLHVRFLRGMGRAVQRDTGSSLGSSLCWELPGLQCVYIGWGERSQTSASWLQYLFNHRLALRWLCLEPECEWQFGVRLPYDGFWRIVMLSSCQCCPAFN